MKLYGGAEGLFGMNVGGKHEGRGLVPARMV